MIRRAIMKLNNKKTYRKQNNNTLPLYNILEAYF